jgi:hypothetical protein
MTLNKVEVPGGSDKAGRTIRRRYKQLRIRFLSPHPSTSGAESLLAQNGVWISAFASV